MTIINCGCFLHFVVFFCDVLYNLKQKYDFQRPDPKITLRPCVNGELYFKCN